MMKTTRAGPRLTIFHYSEVSLANNLGANAIPTDDPSAASLRGYDCAPLTYREVIGAAKIRAYLFDPIAVAKLRTRHGLSLSRDIEDDQLVIHRFLLG